MKKFADVDAYIDQATKEAQPILQKLRQLIKETLP
jgi:uncharacterized protein YdhG (YjbR/CyaY superfamily)